MRTYILGNEIDIRLKVDNSNSLYTIHLTKKNGKQFLYSKASYYPNDDGYISTKDSYSIIGSYTGVDSGGLFWSLKPKDVHSDFEPEFEEYETIYQIKVESREKILTTDYFIQTITNKNIECRELNDNIKGFLFKNKSAKSNVLFLYGSGGMDNEMKTIANLLAVAGHNVLLLNYCEDQILEEIPIEYFKAGLDWIKNNLEINESGTKIVGLSKGGEAALLLTSFFPESISLVCVINSLTVPFQGINKMKPPHIDQKSSWTFKGYSVDFVNGNLDVPMEMSPGKKIDLFPFYGEIFKDRKAVYEKVISINDFKGKVFLFSSKDDRFCPSYEYSELFIKKNANAKIKHFTWENAGHILGWPGFQEMHHFYNGPFIIGGTKNGNGLAAKESWKKIKEVLNDKQNTA